MNKLSDFKDPLLFFDNYLISAGRVTLWKEFGPTQEELEEGIYTLDEINEIKKSLQRNYETHGQEVCEEHFKDYIQARFIKEIKLAREMIISMLLQSSEEVQKGQLTEITKRVLYFISSAERKFEYPSEKQSFKKVLIQLNKYITDTYLSKTKEPSTSKYFKGFGLIYPFTIDKLKSLCFELRRLDGLNRFVTDESNLEDLLKCKNLNSTSFEVHFTCKTVDLAYILRQITPHVHDASDANIGRSKRFYTMEGHFLTAGNLSKSFSTFNNPSLKKSIDLIFRKILKQ